MTAAVLRALVVGLVVVVSARAGNAASVAVLPLGGDVDVATRTAWTTALRAAVAGVAGHAGVPAATVSEALVTADALGNGCAPVEPACIARLGALATASLAVGGRVDPSRDGVAIVVELVDVARARPVRRVVFPTRAAPEGDAAQLLAVRLLAPELERAFVAVRGALPGASISVDGEVRAVAPLPAPIEVRPGRHELVVDHIEHDAVERTFDVALGQTAVIDVSTAYDAAPPAAAEAPAVGVEDSPAVRRALRVRVALIDRSPDIPAASAALLAARIREVLRGVDGVVVVDDAAGADPSPAIAVADDDPFARALDLSRTVVDEAALGPVDLSIQVSLALLNHRVHVTATATRIEPFVVRRYQQRARGSNLDAALARQAGPLVAAMLQDEAVGAVPTTDGGGLPPWVLPATIAVGGASAVASAVAGGLWLAGDARSTPLAAACVAGVAATGIIAIVAVVEAQSIR